MLGFLLLFFTLIRELSALSITVNDVECVYEYVLYEGDTISGNFVVVDHDIFWGSDHPGIDMIVSQLHSPICFFTVFSIRLLRSLSFFMFFSFDFVRKFGFLAGKVKFFGFLPCMICIIGVLGVLVLFLSKSFDF